jgi:hypothetical protein
VRLCNHGYRLDGDFAWLNAELHVPPYCSGCREKRHCHVRQRAAPRRVCFSRSDDALYSCYTVDLPCEAAAELLHRHAKPAQFLLVGGVRRTDDRVLDESEHLFDNEPIRMGAIRHATSGRFIHHFNAVWPSQREGS